MSNIFYVILILLIGGIGLYCILLPLKVKEIIHEVSNMHIRLIGIILLIVIGVITIQYLTISSLVGLLNALE